MLSFLVVSICYVCRLFLFTPVINRMHWAFRSDQSIKGLSPRRARRLVQLAVLTIRMFQSKWLRCFSHTLMEGVRRDPEKCSLNPTTWSLTVVNDYVYMCLLYQRPIYSGNYSRGVGGSTGVGNSNFLVNKFIGADLAHFKSD